MTPGKKKHNCFTDCLTEQPRVMEVTMITSTQRDLDLKKLCNKSVFLTSGWK